jgi:hypothetical protein
MSSFSWKNGVDGDWNTGTLWTPATVPNDIAADVTIDAADTLYTVTIAAGETETVNSLSMNGDTGKPGTNDANNPYHAARLQLDGTLAFAPGSAGLLDGALQTILFTDGGANAEILNGGTLKAFIQSSGNLLLTGTNGIYITNAVQALQGTITIDTSSIAEMDGNTLFDGIFEAKGPGAIVNLGGAREGLVVNIATIEGPPLMAGVGWTELKFNDPTAVIDEWNGSSYVPVESTLTEIAGAGTVDVLAGRDYNTANTLTIDAGGSGIGPGMFNLQAGVVTTGGININGGVVQGYGTIASGVVNNGTLIALGGTVNSTLDVTGSLIGTGQVMFDLNDQSGSADPTKATLELAGVSPGQTVVMNGGDTLILATPSAFAGTIVAGVGDQIVLNGLTATSAALNNGTLVVSNGTVAVASLAMSGNYSGDSVAINGSIVTFGTTVLPTIAGTSAGQTVSDLTTITPFANVVIADTNVGQTETVTVTLSAAANGTLTNLGGGTYDAATGVYTVAGAAAAVTAALNALVFTPTPHEVVPGQTITTGFTISDIDTALQTATDSTTSVIATAGAAAPTITGSVAHQSVTDLGTIAPLANVTIEDANLGQTETVTVTLSAPANGTLTNLGGGAYDAATGVYATTGAAAAVTTALDGLLFVPTQGEVPSGQTVTTGFTIGITDTALASASDATTSVITTATTPPTGEIILGGSAAQYVIASNGGTLYLQDTVPGRNGTQELPGVDTMKFTDGTGVFDPTGSAEDVDRLYYATLGRAPDLGGLEYWTAQIDDSNVPLSDVANAFATAPEFIQKYGSLSDGDFVSQLYQNVLGRPADPAGAQFWDGMLGSGASRGSISLAFSESAENLANTVSTAGDVNNAEAYRLYTTILGRAPDQAGEAFWSATLAGGATPVQVAQSFVVSAEFQQKYGQLSVSDFVSTLYQNALGRQADPAGLQFWSSALQNGESQANVAVAFSDSLESRAATASATHANWVFVPT